jgi:hypothetical protein
MSAASNYLENKVLDHVLRNAEYTQPAGLFIGLFKNNALTNLEAGTLTDEVATAGGTNYARKAVTFGNAASGSASNSGTVTFDAAQADWGTITAIGVMDSITVGAGNVLFYGNLTTAKLIENGDTLQFVSNNVTVTLA